MSELRKAKPLETPRVFPCLPPFSNFKYVEDQFGPLPSLSRILSQCRKSNFQTIVSEKIENIGYSKKDDDVLNDLKAGLISSELIRLSFFTSKIKNINELKKVDPSSFIGYAIIKKVTFQAGMLGDLILKKNGKLDGFLWYVYESVIQSSRHDNNYVHVQKRYEISINGISFIVKGNLYCQQNSLTHVCAHVALRTALSTVLPEGDISYSEINSILEKNGIPHSLGDPLRYSQILKVIEAKGFSIFKFSFKTASFPDPPFPYNKFIYAGIESGWPVLLGIHFPSGEGHIIPILGHTFNEDTWVSYADVGYFFQIGKSTSFMSSETWVSTYIGQDDNFGSNFCIPRNYLENQSLSILIIAPKECKYDGIDAEAIAIDYLYSIVPEMGNRNENFWVKKLLHSCVDFKVVLRAQLISRDEYIIHLREMEGWGAEKLSSKVVNSIDEFLKTVSDLFWMVEVSHPELFPANHRKLGEILLDASIKPNTTRDFKNFVLARLPENFYFLSNTNQPSGPTFVDFPSPIKDHAEIYCKTKDDTPNQKTNFISKVSTALRKYF